MQSTERQQVDRVQPDVVQETEVIDPSYYQKTLDEDLDKNMFKADAYRACWFIWSFSLSAIFFLAVVAFKLEWPSQLAIAVLIGYFNTMMYHSTHEIMHGNVLKKKWMEDVIGLLGFTPLLISPTFWRTWHNEIHHSRTNQGRLDPESWPMLDDYKNSKIQKILFSLTPGSGTKKSYLFFFYWASAKSLLAHWYYRFSRKDMLFVNNWRVSGELLVQMAIWYYALNLVSVDKWLWCFVIPLVVQNYLISSNEVAAH
ncbi:MAG: fatty acid desaturase, partial [Bacteriovoracaceae bacterium]|nr:fatty acid desaturase [Bacteriovoracaceae bacterium]